MNYCEMTARYYSKWIGIEDVLLEEKDSLFFCFSLERDKVQYGYSKPYDLYVFCVGNRKIVSYGSNVDLEKIKQLEKQCKETNTIKDLKNAIETIFESKVSHNVKFCFDSLKLQSTLSRPLQLEEYDKYYDFFITNNPKVTNTDWLFDYFQEMIRTRLCCGIFMDNILVSCTDMPGMPYMQDEIQEIGINTLINYKGKGYASDACTLMISNIIKAGKCPMWSTHIDNIGSIRLAENIGFSKFGDVLSISL